MNEAWKIENCPVHRAVWQHGGVDDFDCTTTPPPAAVRGVMDRSLAVVRQHQRAGSLYAPVGSLAPALLDGLATAGFWGLRAGTAYGGAGATFQALARFITEVAVLDPWVAGMVSVHACIGPVGLLEGFGSAEQKQRLLRPLAAGRRLGAFAVTEPASSTDWHALRTVAQPAGDDLLVTGDKLFITNAGPGRTIGLLCLVDGRHQMLLVELPAQEGERFRTVRYELKAPAHLQNVGLVFNGLPVPRANLLQPPRGDGRAIAHQALDQGRVAVCANAAGQLRLMAASVIPWVQQRQTFGAPIGSRELVQRRLGWLAGRIVACDAMTDWTAQLLDRGYRAELECVTAKVFGSESVKEAAVDVLLKTHGGRALLAGNLFADDLFDLLAPTVYEGENEVLTLGYFQSLVRAHAEQALAPIAAALKHGGPDAATAGHPSAADLLAAGRHAASYAAWLVGEEARHAVGQLRHRLPAGDADADELAAVALDLLAATARETSAAMRHFGAAMAQRQALAFDLARRAQWATVMLVVSRHAARQQDPLLRQAGLCAATDLGARLTGSRTTGAMHHQLTSLGRAVAEDRFPLVGEARRGEVSLVLPLAAKAAQAEV